MADYNNILFFLGAPGAGKGTLASHCVRALGYEQLSTGNLCREHIAQCTQIGKSIDLALKSGKLIDDSVITQMVVEWMREHPQKLRIILDGYPRTVVQAEAFHSFIAGSQEQRPAVVRLVAREQAVIERLSLRLICSNKECQAVYSLANDSACRPKKDGICDRCLSVLTRRGDDEVEAITKRLRLYGEHERALLDFYTTIGYRLFEIDALQPAEHVFSEFKTKLGHDT